MANKPMFFRPNDKDLQAFDKVYLYLKVVTGSEPNNADIIRFALDSAMMRLSNGSSKKVTCFECESSNVIVRDTDENWTEFECKECGCVWEKTEERI